MTTIADQPGIKKQGAEDAVRYFRYMAEFVGFTQAEVEAIRETRFIIEKYIPEIVSKFYTQLLRYPTTRKYFMENDGTLDQDYLQLRMRHLGNFWRRTASGVFDDEYARYVDYVGRAHTPHGADPHIYIPERYVIGQVGFIQHAISEAIVKELHDIDPEWEIRALRAWNLLMMVILEMLARAYGDEREPETFSSRATIDQGAVLQLAVETYELGLGMRSVEPQDVVVGRAADIPDGERKIVQVDDLSIGVFHHKGGWYAVRNSCQHRGGPVATGSLEGDILTCPWHGYKYNVINGQLLTDPDAKLDMYPVEMRQGEIQGHLFAFIPFDTLCQLQNRNSGFQNVHPVLVHPMRNGNPVPQTGGHGLFAGQHSVNILRQNTTGTHQQFARLSDGLCLVCGACSKGYSVFGKNAHLVTSWFCSLNIREKIG